MPAHHPSPLRLPPLGGSSSCAWGEAPSSAPSPALKSCFSTPPLRPDRGDILGEGGSQEFQKQSSDGILKAETTCFWRLGCPTSLVMRGNLTTNLPWWEGHRLWSQTDAGPELRLLGLGFPHL